VKVLEAKHRSCESFYVAMILFHNIVEVFALSNFDSLVVVTIKLLDAGFGEKA